jgi:hypothetical protein
MRYFDSYRAGRPFVTGISSSMIASVIIFNCVIISCVTVLAVDHGSGLSHTQRLICTNSLPQYLAETMCDEVDNMKWLWLSESLLT